MTWFRSLLMLGGGITMVHVAGFAVTAMMVQSHGGDMEHMISSKDQGEYMSLAHVLLSEHRFALTPDAPPEVFRTPGYPAFILLINAVSRDWFWALFLVHAVLAGAVSILVALLTHELRVRMRWALAAGLVAGLSSGLFLLTTTGTGGDILYALLYSAAALVALRSGNDRSWKAPAVLGLLLALATYVRPIGMIASLPLLFGTALIPVCDWHTYLRKTFVACAAFTLMLTPWVARNTLVAGAPVFSTVSTYNLTYYNIPFAEAFWTGRSERETRSAYLSGHIGTTSEEALRGTTYLNAMQDANSAYLSSHFKEYMLFHAIRTTPFFLASGFNVINAVLAHEAPALHIPLFPTEGENLTRAISEHRWHDVLFALSRYWFTSLERLGWLLAIGAAFAAPLLSSGRERRILLLFAVIIIANIILVSPVTQARYRFPAEPFIWAAAVYTGATLWNRYRHPRT